MGEAGRTAWGWVGGTLENLSARSAVRARPTVFSTRWRNAALHALMNSPLWAASSMCQAAPCPACPNLSTDSTQNLFSKAGKLRQSHFRLRSRSWRAAEVGVTPGSPAHMLSLLVPMPLAQIGPVPLLCRVASKSLYHSWVFLSGRLFSRVIKQFQGHI